MKKPPASNQEYLQYIQNIFHVPTWEILETMLLLSLPLEKLVNFLKNRNSKKPYKIHI